MNPRIAIVALVSSLSLVALAGEKPVAPSTGKEMPHAPASTVLSGEQMKEKREAGIKEFVKKDRNCPQVVSLLTAGLWGGERPMVLNSASEPAYMALAACATTTRHWMMAYSLSSDLVNTDPKFPIPALLLKSEIGVGEYAQAKKDGVILAKRYPKDEDVAAYRAMAACKLEEWPDCEKLALAAQSMAKTNVATVALGEAYFHQGKFDESTAEIQKLADAMPDEELFQKRLKRNAIVKDGKLGVEPEYPKEIPLGTYHLLGQVKDVAPLLRLKLYNFQTTNRNIRVEVDLAGASEKFTKTKLLLPGKKEVVDINPPLKSDAGLSDLKAEKQTVLNIKVTALDKDGEKPLYEKAYPVTLLPHDMLPLSQSIDADTMKPVPGFMAAWITPNARGVDEFLQKAKGRVDGTFAGEQRPTIPQVKAIWDELQSEGVSYVMDPMVLSQTGLVQRTRLPAEILTLKNAQCIEGTLLFATLLESVGIRPIIVRVPGHAFVGWHADAKDGVPPNSVFYVETTMVHDAKFEDAVLTAKARVDQERKEHHFDKGIYGPAFMVELTDLRKQGFKPQPL